MPAPGLVVAATVVLALTMGLAQSGVFPGLGQLYNRRPSKGVAFLAAGIVLSWLFIRANRTAPLPRIQPGTDLIVSLFLLILVWFWSIIDAWPGASQ